MAFDALARAGGTGTSAGTPLLLAAIPGIGGGTPKAAASLYDVRGALLASKAWRTASGSSLMLFALQCRGKPGQPQK